MAKENNVQPAEQILFKSPWYSPQNLHPEVCASENNGVLHVKPKCQGI